MIRDIAQVRADGQCRVLVLGIELRGNERITQGNITAGRQKDFFPDPHVLVGWRGVPVHPGDSQIVLPRREYFDGQSIGLAGA